MAKATYIYYEAKTGLIFDEPPRERNVYTLRDSADVRKHLDTLSGQELVSWLERATRI